MKKILLINLALIFIGINVTAQNNLIKQQVIGEWTPEIELASEDGPFYINGVSSSEDIGGVEVETERNDDPYGNPYMYYIAFKNYRSKAVTVLYQFELRSGDIREGSIILQANERKYLSKRYNTPENFKLIVRSLD